MGVFLQLEPSTIDQLADAEKDAVACTVKMLQAWLHSPKTAGGATTLYDELSAGFLSIKRADILNFVRCGECVAENVDDYLAKCSIIFCSIIYVTANILTGEYGDNSTTQPNQMFCLCP